MLRPFQDFPSDTLPLTADDQHHSRHIRLPDVHGAIIQRRHRHADPRSGAFLLCFLPGGHHHRGAEYGAHACPDDLVAIGVRAALQQSHGNIQRIRRPQDRAQIAGVLDAVQQEHSPPGGKCGLFRHPAEEYRPLGGCHGGDGFHHILRHPHQAYMLRHLHLYAVGEDHRMEPFAVANRLLKQLGAVGGEKALALPLLSGGQELSDLLQQGIFSRCNPLFHHCLCTASRATLSPRTASTSSARMA